VSGDRIAVKNPQQWTRKQFKEMGLQPTGGRGTRGNHGAAYIADSGHMFVIPQSLSTGGAIRLVSDTRAHLGLDRAIVDEKESVPVLVKGSLRFSEHARERWALMRGQAAVGAVELEACLFNPSEVSYSVKHNTWLFIGARVKAAVAFPETGDPVVTTVIWTREEMFEQHPRPEGKRA
jgi:hypothetical protein